MSKSPQTRPLGPAHLRPITIEIPTTWSPEQALAVYELLDDLREKIWDRYHYTLQNLLQQQLQSPGIGDGDASVNPNQSRAF